MSIGGKNSSQKYPCSSLSQAKALLCTIMKWWSSACSSGRRKCELSLSSCSFLCHVYWPVGVNRGGWGVKRERSASGSPFMFLRMRNLAGRFSKTGLTLHTTGLYFFLADINVGIQWLTKPSQCFVVLDRLAWCEKMT